MYVIMTDRDIEGDTMLQQILVMMFSDDGRCLAIRKGGNTTCIERGLPWRQRCSVCQSHSPRGD